MTTFATAAQADDAVVWVAVIRRGVTAHNPNGAPLGILPTTNDFQHSQTVCGRSMRTGTTMTVKKAAEQLNAVWCRNCYAPDPAGVE